ncbi:sulfotransferase domain-containing protein [Actinoplanes sp. TBRC 11911]|uniref:sulfotransferase domain-containing protein n=1 Tax=Actinoplanes sp. TBRC 11911 TaxID=2729386 RepID=UPI00145F9D0D|nr:sulfotransferase domain-containing protein [Actinoplanes sp. TBRC 11911]NMO51826.1 sulfotransferase domain-containing protein [Actinoplanes sp. TBRC 11911]
MAQRYRGWFVDNARWDHIELRAGDIILTVPPKSGTTWIQMICALLIFQTPDLPRPLGELSPWPDYLVHPREEVVRELAGQRHRRFIKTHTPPDGLPYDARVTYLTIGRDPRDAGLSLDNHRSNTNLAVLIERFNAASRADGVEPPRFPEVPPASESIHDRFRAWVDSPEFMFGLPSYMRHLDIVWRRLDRPNVILTHYQQLKDDLAGSMRGLAETLEIDVPEHKWPELVEAATFGGMKKREADVVSHRDMWLDESRFLHKGTSGRWRSVLDDEDLTHYRERVATLAGPDLLSWVHRGQESAG